MLGSLLKTYLRIPHRGQSKVLELLKRTSISKSITITSETGLTMEADWSDWAGLYLLRHRCLEPQTSKLLLKLLLPGQTFLDVGAHIGYLSLIAAQRVGTSGRVISIEPQPRNCERLLASSVKNKLSNITLYCAAAGAQTGTIKLCPQGEADHSSLSLLKDVSSETFGFVVPIVKLEDTLNQAGCTELNVLKMDVEGYEIEAAKGLDWNGRFRPRHVIAEALSNTVEDRLRTNRFVDYMTSLGYTYTDIHGTAATRLDELDESNLWFSYA